jgi:hypothetical protein
MTAKDKTGDQLVASIRKTKQAATTSKKTAARKSQPKKSTAKAPAKKPSTTAKTTPRQKPAAGEYQQGKRVWPD